MTQIHPFVRLGSRLETFRMIQRVLRDDMTSWATSKRLSSQNDQSMRIEKFSRAVILIESAERA